jgi:hypothetical protein
VQETRQTCLEAKVSDDLDPLLLRCAALQTRRERGNDVMTERLQRKLEGVAETLTAWTSYLDFQKTGDGKRANDILRGLLNQKSQYPILKVDDIESRFVDVVDTQDDLRSLGAKIFAGINGPDDLPKALERLEAYGRKPSAQQKQSLNTEISHVTAFMDAWKAIQAGETANAASLLGRSFGGYEDVQRYYVPIKAQIESRLLTTKAKSWTKLEQNPGESATTYLRRILDELRERNDYPTMLEVMSFANQIDHSSPAAFSSTERQSIEHFLAGQRFAKAGDSLAAVTSYRMAISDSSGKYAPVEKAQEELKELQTKYPDAFKSYEGVLLEQMRTLSQQLQNLQNRPPGFPYRP